MSEVEVEEEEEEEGSMTVRNFLKILSSYNSNVLLAALVFLLLVILFVLLLHFYARFFWSPSHQQLSSAQRHRRRITVTSTTRTIPSVSFGGFNGAAATSDDKGLDSSVISSIPLFIYEYDEKEEDECTICLGLWEVGDVGRKLRNCGHGFHVECINMWLSSHSTCPLCRSLVLKPPVNDDVDYDGVNCVEEEEEEEVTLQLFLAGEEDNVVHDRSFSSSIAAMEDDRKTDVDDVHGGEVRVEVFAGEEEEINGGGSRADQKMMHKKEAMYL